MSGVSGPGPELLRGFSRGLGELLSLTILNRCQGIQAVCVCVCVCAGQPREEAFHC